MTAQSLRTSLGSNGHTVGDTCIDLYAERVMIPRISLFSLLTGLSVLTVLFIRHRRRRTRQSAKLLREKVVLESSEDPHTSRKRWFACFLATTVAWITIFLCTFNSSTAKTSTSMSAAQARPRTVFSFTTTPRGIDEMQPTVDALVHQEGDGFDAVYVIVPRTYRDKVVDIPTCLAIGVNSISFVGGAGGVAVKRKFFGMGEATMPAFEVANMSKACYLGDDYYLSHLLSRNGVRRRLVADSCWNIETLTESFSHGGLSYAPSEHPGGANVEHYQQCIRELGKDQDLSRDGEFGSAYMFLFSRTWGVLRGLRNLYFGGEFVSC
ncbi:hypothetical protein JG688_00015109 [Phytophthora aleatoria]|uniref:Uncharacterized protein n=1 Tax=Phytophthora aleatoria TaxID=2496075 RepID=A0A8J5IW92_9STRA|nr:hypothetical protein JG688_00015109 [Phytophthora aleatoria]